MTVAAIFAVGTSVGGTPDAIAAILKDEASLDVYLLYGNQASSDSADPKRFVEEIKNGIQDVRVTWAMCQAVEPFDMSQTYRQVRTFINGLAQRSFGRVYVGITGGANPIVASLFQTAMAYLSCQVIPVYVQAKGTSRIQHFVASDVRDQVTAEEVLSRARSGQVRIAAQIAERLPNEGPWKFLRATMAALSLWDDFDYSQARQGLVHQARKLAEYSEHALLAPVAETVARFAGSASDMSAFEKQIRDRENFSATAMAADWAERVSRIGALLVADALANADRRIKERRFTDAVLRSYRAAECATQMRLLAIGIHPQQPDTCKAAYERYFPDGKFPARPLDFEKGLDRLVAAGLLNREPIHDQIKRLQFTRNFSYLEHGYERIQLNQAENCFEWSLAICEHLLGPAIRQIWRGFEMRF
ncbi:MAG TPA: hypothetical protein VKV17_02225 [Bryobacteraceae bacterium]|nr:hypothetical protein [Bryobacteraceae bacterium]